MSIWTYQNYNFANTFIVIALGVVTFIVLFLTERFTSATYYLFTNSLFGIHRPTIPKNKNSVLLKHGKTDKNYTAAELMHIIDVFGHHVNLGKRKHLVWRIILLLLTGSTIWLFFIQIFSSVILRYQVVYPDEICPSFLADCFAIPTGTFDYSLIGTATCSPGDFFTFPIVDGNGTAHCFGWVIKHQDTASVLAAIGSAAALVTFVGKAFTVMFHLTYEHMRSYKWLVVAVFIGIILLWTGVIVYLFQQKVTTNIQTYYVLIHIALVKSLALIWGYAAEYEELSPDEKVAFWPLYHNNTPVTQPKSESEVTSQQQTTVSRFNEVDRKTSAVTNRSVIATTSATEEKKRKFSICQTIKDISRISPEQEERSENENNISQLPTIPDARQFPCSIL
jgi:hypothetical protein